MKSAIFGLRCRRVVGKVVGKLSEIKLVTSLLASSKIAAIRSVWTWAENHAVLCCYKSKVSNFEFTEDPKLPQEWLKEWKEDRFNPNNTDSRVCADQFTPQVTKAIPWKIIGGFPWKIPKNPNKVWKTLRVMCLLCFCRFSELLEVVLSDKLPQYKPSMSAEGTEQLHTGIPIACSAFAQRRNLEVRILHFV